MQTAIMVIGAVAEIVGWWLVSARGRDVWRVMPVVLGAMGVAAALARHPVAASRVSTSVALLVGVLSGSGLYVGTRTFVWVASRWDPFRLDVVERYRQAGTVALGTSLGLSLLLMVPAEELFWRGLFQVRLGVATGAAAGAALTWLAYVLVNLSSRSLPIVAGAIVGGALWAGLAWWSGGMAASLASHILWTGSMLALPPGPGRRAMVS
jgi:membrane protease YdiL (CAAX protease family)